MRKQMAHLGTLLVLITTLTIWQAAAADPPTDSAPRSTTRRLPGTSDSSATTSHQKVDINSATQAELEALPGIGPATASAIIKARPFRSVNELTNVSGIGPAKLTALKPEVTVRSHEPTVVRRSATGERSTSSSVATRNQKVDLNTATQEELEALPGIGAVTASAIIKARPFANVNELTNVSGIGPAKLTALKPEVTVRSHEPAIVSRSAAGERSTPSSVGRSATGERSTASSRTATTPPHVGEMVNLNTATKEELEALPDIGPVRAQAIIEARPFSSIEDVKRVKGIKEGVFSRIKDQITVK